MATYTPNYNLKKPDGSDFIHVADLNGNFDAIDSQMKANSTPSWNSITNKPELYTKSEVDDLLENVEIDVDSALSDSSENPVQNKVIKSALDNKVDKVNGKGLSTNDYTTAEKSKLEGIAAGAEVNVNADLNATSGDAQILNNPFSIVDGMIMVTFTEE